MFNSIDIQNKKTIRIEIGKYIILIFILSVFLYFLAKIADNYIENYFLQLIIDVFLLFLLFFIFATILGFKVTSYLKLRVNTFYINVVSSYLRKN